MCYKVTLTIIHKVTHISRKKCDISAFSQAVDQPVCHTGTTLVTSWWLMLRNRLSMKKQFRKENLHRFYARRLRMVFPFDKMELSTWEVFLWRQN